MPYHCCPHLFPEVYPTYPKPKGMAFQKHRPFGAASRGTEMVEKGRAASGTQPSSVIILGFAL